ncbi:MAG: spore germination protein [Clostridia bacterium]|jgi:spore germination protein KA|nr:spore germination protein [Clostridia bacterium]
MNRISGNLNADEKALKEILSAEDILTFPFRADGGIEFTVVYADAITDKELLGEQVVRPLLHYAGKPQTEEVKKRLTSPELKTETDFNKLAQEVLTGNPVLLWEGMNEAIVTGVKKVFPRAIAEPPTDIAVKGPREGFIEDIKINTSLVRKRLKTPELQLDTVTVGRRSKTVVTVCYIKGTAPEKTVAQIKEKLQRIDIDIIPDSSYLPHFLAEKPRSLLKQVGTTEKPDIFCAKMAEGRVGILVDGSPIALTLPYLLIEDFQSSEDYFVPTYRATFTRLLRAFALFVAIYMPAFYIAAQLFKLQFFPIKLLLTIAGSIQNIPFSPSLEMLLVLLVLEVLNEASIRMPKYVGMALSVVGALVLGETAVNAGFVSTPAIIIIAFSGIGLYAVPNLIEITSVIRLAMLLVAGSVGTYGIILLTAFILFYLATTDNFGVPVLSPFAPFVRRDLRDSLIKFDLLSLEKRPKTLKSKNKRRLTHE